MRTLLPLAVLILTLFVSGCAGNEKSESSSGLPVHCLDRPDPGPCGKRIPRYYYDYPSNTCRSFHYGGCSGHVPFESRSACEEACVADQH